jgi:streptogramin lyase
MIVRVRSALALGALAGIAACSGGGGTSLPAGSLSGGSQPSQTTATATPSANPVATPSAPSTAAITQTFTITIPARTATHMRGRRQSISSSAGSVRIAVQSVNGQPSALATLAATAPGSSGCVTALTGTTCSFAAAAELGDDVFVVSTYASSNGTGAVLASTAIASVVSSVAAHAIALTVAGVPTSIGFSPIALPLVNDGAIHRYAVTLDALDASGAIIVGSTPYQSPVTLTIANDPTHALSLSTSIVEDPGTVVTVTFDGSRDLMNAAIVASVDGLTANLSAAPLKFSPSALLVYDDQVGGAAITIAQAGFAGAFTATLANPNDGKVTTTAGPLGSGSAVATVRPATTFDVTSMSVNNGLFTAQVPVTIVPQPGPYTAFGQPHVLLQPYGLVRQANGILWTGDTQNGVLVAFNPATGTYASYPVDPNDNGPTSLAFDTAGNLWFADRTQIGKFNTTTHTATDYSAGLGSNARVTDIALGPSGTMAFYDEETNNPPLFGGNPSAIGFISTSTGAIHEYATPDMTTPSAPSESLTLGPDGAEWFADASSGSIGRIDAAGTYAIYRVADPASPNYQPDILLSAPDGNIWFAGLNNILGEGFYGTVNPTTHAVALYPIESAEFDAFIVGSDHNLWFAARPEQSFFYSSQDTIGVINVATHAGYFYPAIVPQFGVVAGLVDPGNRTLYTLDNAYGRIGEVPFK